ncbi:unnamed protein product [Tuber aestivum]|uniref:Uncharacterized protein n=1 Tax=Tuber aestivum TaxID=59557 RepID=A0A292Q0C2_9PEZI|nr:unnamed protein product [Tuber aestivum]
MAISIYKAFGDLGENSTAHNLVLGLLVCWLPVLVAAAIVDRNQMGSHYVRTKLNIFLRKTVKIALIPNAFPGVREPNFFRGFAGQARVWWHSGAAHSILQTMEATLDMRRDWLARYPNTDEILAMRTHSGLLIFDKSQGWQIAAAIMIVFSCSIGALIVRYFTSALPLRRVHDLRSQRILPARRNDRMGIHEPGTATDGSTVVLTLLRIHKLLLACVHYHAADFRYLQ